MRKYFQLLSFVFACISQITWAQSSLRIEGPHSDRVHKTSIEASLDVDEHRVEARMQLEWTNKTGVAHTSIPFHLYLNAFSSTETPFMKESGGQLRGDESDSENSEGYGYIIVTELTDADGNDLLPQWQVDTDTAILQLNETLQPGETLKLNFQFTSQLPKVFARSGHDGNTFNFVAQWFPKPSVYFKGRWVNHNYHAHSEYFADFGEYDVRLTVPSDYMVGATGVLVETKQKEEQNSPQTEYRFVAEDVHDFVWTADKNFAEATTEWKGVTIRLLFQKELDPESVQYQLDVAKASFQWLNDVVGPYPYASMTLVQPTEEGAGAGGMEYPMLVTTIPNIEKSRFHEFGALVTIHEIGHNYWQGMIATNEFEESWLDEGINSYAEGRILKEALDKQYIVNVGPIKLDMESAHRMGTAGYKDYDPVLTNSWSYISGGSYGINSYSKPATILNTVEQFWGKDKVDALLKNYYGQWAFKHPTTVDFISIAKTIDRAMGEFIEQAVSTTDSIDLRVYKFKSSKKDINGGFDLNSDERPLPFTKANESENYFNELTLLREGNLKLPKVNVRLVYQDGSTEVREWILPYETKWTRWQWQSDKKLVEVFIDPEFKVLLDKNVANNLKQLKPSGSWRWLFSFTQSLHNLTSTLLPL